MAKETAMPTVSVVIPVHNAGDLLLEALESVYAQTYRDFEVLVIDDASSDGAAERVRSFPREVRYLKQPHAGSAVARNRGVILSRGKYVAFLDADDTWAASKLEKQVALLESDPDLVVAYSDFERSEQQQQRKQSGVQARQHRVAGEELKSLLRQNFLHTSSVVVRRDAFAEAGIFDPKLKNAQDWDMWIRLAEAGSFGFVDEILTHYRLHSNQSVRTLSYPRNVVFADRLVLARYARQPELAKVVRLKLGWDLWLLGRRELKLGSATRAREAFWESFKLGYRMPGSLARILYCTFPAFLRRQPRSQQEPGAS